MMPLPPPGPVPPHMQPPSCSNCLCLSAGQPWSAPGAWRLPVFALILPVTPALSALCSPTSQMLPCPHGCVHDPTQPDRSVTCIPRMLQQFSSCSGC